MDHTGLDSEKSSAKNRPLRFVSGLAGLLSVLAILAIILPLDDWLIPRTHYLPLHTLMELASIFAAFLVFATIWHTPSKEVPGSLVLLAIALLAAGWLDIGHTLSLTGMPDFVTPSSPVKSMWFWLTARLMVALNLLAYSFFPDTQPYSTKKKYLILSIYSLINIIIFAVIIFYEALLPNTYVTGSGVTPFKVWFEYFIVLILAISAWRIYVLAKRTDDETTALLFGAAFTALLSELILADYEISNAGENVVAHLFKIIAYLLIYRALFVGSIRRPYQKLAAQTNALLSANAILRTQALALESTTTPVMVTDPQGYLSWRNPASAALWSRLSSESKAQLNIFEAPLTPDPLQAAEVKQTLMSGRAWSGLVHIHDSHGNPFIMDRTITPLRNEAGQVEGYVSVSENRTESLLALNAQRTLERQLQHSQKIQALGQLTSGIAHDFNNILSSILGYTNLAISRFVPDKQSKLASYLKEVVQASERARQLIDKMLAFARTERQNSTHTARPSAVIEEVISMLRPSFPSSIQILTNIECDPTVNIDAGELNQVLVNLVINAKDAISDQGKISVRLHEVNLNVKTCAADQSDIPAGKYVALDVIDTGHGISPEHLPHLFEPFFTTKEVGKGTGLGLAMVHGMIRRAKGFILVESKPQQGSCFQLLFPGASPSPTSQVDSVESLKAPKGAGQKIWVVDDESAIVGYLHELLTYSGYEVRGFTDPNQVLKAFHTDSNDLDLLISDQTMPGINGDELAKKLRVLRPDLPIILCSGNGLPLDVPALKTAGIQHVLDKPMDSAALLTAIASELDKKLISQTSLDR